MPDIIFQCLQYIQYKQFIQYIQYLQYFTKEWNTIYTIQWLCISKTDREPAVLFYVRGSCKTTRTTNGQSLSELWQNTGHPFILSPNTDSSLYITNPLDLAPSCIFYNNLW